MNDTPAGPVSSGLVDRAKAMIMSPVTEWPKVATETDPPMKVFTGYALPLFLIGPVAGFIGMMVFGVPQLFGTARVGMSTLLTGAILSIVLGFISVWVIAWAANFLSPKNGGKDDFAAAFRLVAYALTAHWVGGIFGLFPALSIIGVLFSLYSIYVFYKGAQPVMNVPEDKSLVYTVLTIIVAIIINIIIRAIGAAITAPALLSGVNVSAADASGDNVSIDMGQYGTIEASENGSVVNIRGADGEEVTFTVETGE